MKSMASFNHLQPHRRIMKHGYGAGAGLGAGVAAGAGLGLGKSFALHDSLACLSAALRLESFC